MTPKFPIISFIYDRYKNASSKRKAVVEIRITHNRKQKYISTGIMLYPSQWKKDQVVNIPEAPSLNALLDKFMSDIRKVIIDMASEGNIDIFSIQNVIEGNKKESMSFMEFCKRKAEVRKYGKAKDTQERYDRFIRMFKKWGKIKTFKDITPEKIIAYDQYLKKSDMQPQSRWHNYHRFLKSFIIDAIEEEHVKKNPYKMVKIDRGEDREGLRRCLSPSEFNRIREARMPTKSLERVRDIFIFQTYTCLSYSDMKQFDNTCIQEIKGMKVYIGNRRKTKKGFTIPLLPEALEILKKYSGKLPMISNVKYNEYLKIVVQAAGIDKPVSTHWARHTGATLLLNNGVPMQIVSKICGHSSIRMTEQVYAKLLDETVVAAIQGIIK